MYPAKNTPNKTQNKKIGNFGEEIAARYLTRRGFKILQRNYLKKCGEIDIIARFNKRIHFIEVKTVSYETKAMLQQAVTHETWRPENNVHPQKIKKISRAIECWLSEELWDGDWQIDVLAVRIVPRETYATIKYIDNVIF